MPGINMQILLKSEYDDTPRTPISYTPFTRGSIHEAH